MLTVSRQLLVQQTGPELDRILISDLSRQLDSFLDQVALYATGPSGNQPLELVGVPGVSQVKVLPSVQPIRITRSVHWKHKSKLRTCRWIPTGCFCLWGRGIELLIDSVTMALTGRIKSYSTLLADIGVRYPASLPSRRQ